MDGTFWYQLREAQCIFAICSREIVCLKLRSTGALGRFVPGRNSYERDVGQRSNQSNRRARSQEPSFTSARSSPHTMQALIAGLRNFTLDQTGRNDTIRTEDISLVSNIHGRERRLERNILRAELQAAIKYGRKENANPGQFHSLAACAFCDYARD
eukprot:2067475-Rhodomonas_salina.2